MSVIGILRQLTRERTPLCRHQRAIRYTCGVPKGERFMKSSLYEFPLRQRVAVLLLGAVLISIASGCRKKDAVGTDFLAAAGSGDLAKVRLLLDRDPNLAFSKNRDGSTALHYAASYGFLEIAELLLTKNADVNAKNSEGSTPLHYASSYGHKDIAELLLSNKANANIGDGIGRTPLYDAAAGGRIEEVRILLAAKADENAGTLHGHTPLSAAAARGREDVVRLLIENGANVNAADLDGCTPLHWARIHGYERIEGLLREHGAIELPRAKSEWPYP
jgi:ankyrin repeat protein